MRARIVHEAITTDGDVTLVGVRVRVQGCARYPDMRQGPDSGARGRIVSHQDPDATRPAYRPWFSAMGHFGRTCCTGSRTQ